MTSTNDLIDLFDAEERAAPDPAARALRRRRVRRTLIIVTVVVLVIAASIAGYVTWALHAPLPAPTASSRTLEGTAGAPVSIDRPGEGATAALVIGAPDYLGADGLRLTAGPDEPQPIASLSKIITALVVLDAHPLADAADPGPTITFGKADHDLYDAYYVQDAAVAEMPTGSSMSLHDALATMLIPSASNYADAVSTWAFGSRGAFLAATRDFLSREGLSGTTIVEPTGLDDRNTSTPRDLLRIAQLAAADPTISAIAGTERMTLPGPGELLNTNTLLGQDGITGLKTGNLGQGTFALLFTASLDVGAGEPLSIVGATLGGTTREAQDAAVLRLLGSIRGGFHTVALVEAGMVVGSYKTAWGGSAQLVVADAAAIRTWSDTPIAVSTELTNPTEYRDGERVGTVTWTAGAASTTAALRVRGAIEPPTDWWRLTHPDPLGR
ncbi:MULTISPECIES: D-alanyl-D-alanine carboxypeptidase family protein [unclassified Microbacterium]|uniref:D-alanyl-D-alanine carboxypeptidase family protein n=1 Tax=unclassified Microbacterium TaxID=2609290 RepID=UPI000DB1380A|nr:MAG: D-alanyl-D-alanine carboxypeptidase [Microbacterium sp.]PZU35265.1 MAG: D-alanyl-D-alanine carboxypeptidase [Microbacterium sp.]